MAYNVWAVTGYGFSTDKLKIDSVDRIELLLSRAPQYRKEIHEYFKENGIADPQVTDYLDFDQDYRLGIASTLQAVIQEATGIEMLACDNYAGNKYLIYASTYPWKLNECEKTLTMDNLKAIFEESVAIISDDKPQLGFQSVVDGG